MDPFSFHLYAGDEPPFVGVAVKVTDIPSHIGFEDGLIFTLTARFAVTVMVTVLEVAGLPVTQVALDVRTQLTTSPLTRELFEYVALFDPTLEPFSFH